MSDLDDKIRSFEQKRDAENKPAPSGTGAMASAGRAGYEILVAVVFFSAVGGLLDWQLGTLPWITLVLRHRRLQCLADDECEGRPRGPHAKCKTSRTRRKNLAHVKPLLSNLPKQE
jgi:hypothetical protein